MIKKIFSVFVCLSIMLSGLTVNVFSIQEDDIIETRSFEDKLIFENYFNGEDLSQNDTSDSTQEIESVSIVLQFKEEFTCDHDEFNDFDDVLEHRNELKEYYTNINQNIISELSLEDYFDISYSWYGPFIEYEYLSYDEFTESDYSDLADKNPNTLDCVYIRANLITTDAGARESLVTAPNYPFSQALTDVGIPTNNQYDGTGIKIGIMESGVPNSTVNLSGTTYQFFNTYSQTDHAFWVASIIGGSSGIAKGSELYFAALDSYIDSEIEACNWMISNGVNVINISHGRENGKYNSFSAYEDYLVRSTKVTIVAAAGNGNRSESNYSGYLIDTGNGINVISVASNTVEKKIAHSSSDELTATWENILLKPTVTAPGAQIVGIPNITQAIAGTSFAAPFVTGIVALLMEEFPDLKAHPEAVMALLTNTCTEVQDHGWVVDNDAGFGIVNYTYARQNYSHVNNFVLSNVIVDRGKRVYMIGVTLPPDSMIKINAYVQCYSNYTGTDDSAVINPVYTKVKVALRDSSTGSITYGTVKKNYSYLLFENLTDSPISYTILLYLETDKVTSELEYGSINYYIEEY